MRLFLATKKHSSFLSVDARDSAEGTHIDIVKPYTRADALVAANPSSAVNAPVQKLLLPATLRNTR
jgi:hypothetical protein